MMPCFPVAAARPKRAVGIDATAVHVPADGAASTIASARARGARTDGPAISVARLNQRDTDRQLEDTAKPFHDTPSLSQALIRKLVPSQRDLPRGDVAGTLGATVRCDAGVNGL